MRILNLDQARTCGYSLFDNGRLVEHGAVELGKKKDVYEKILYQATQIIEKLANETKADIVVLEDIHLQQEGATTYKKLAMLMGSLVSLFLKNETLFDFVSPSTWRGYCGIKGRSKAEKKANAVKHVKLKFGIDASEDEAEAICLGDYTSNNIKLSEGK